MKSSSQVISEVYQRLEDLRLAGKKALILANSNVEIGEEDNLSDYDSEGKLKQTRNEKQRLWRGPKVA